jgi:hypothetical protein
MNIGEAWIRALRPALLGALPLLAAAQTPPPPVTVQLPPMVVADISKGPAWVYTRVGDVELVARCSRSTVRDFVRMRLRLGEALRLVVPPEFLRQSDVPGIYVLYAQSLKKQEDAVLTAMIDEERKRRRVAKENAAPLPELELPGFRRTKPFENPFAAATAVQFLPNQRIEDRDITCTFVYVDDDTFDADAFTLTVDNVFSQLSLRAPALPLAISAGVAQAFAKSGIIEDDFVLAPMTWLSAEATQALRDDPATPRASIALLDLFASDAPGTRDLQSFRAQAWRAQAGLLFRWALEEPARLRAYWKFAARLATELPSERLWRECFGLSTADIRDELSDYLPTAVTKPIFISLKALPKPSSFDVRPATPAQVARVKGEWERAEISFVRQRHPEYLERYIEQAKRTLVRAHDAGDREPSLLAALGLCHVDAGDDAAALAILGAAAEAQVVRPRVYAELARIRQQELAGTRPAGARFSSAELAFILEPLRAGARQRPAMQEIFVQLAQTWRSCTDAPGPGDFELLRQGTELFPRNAELALHTAGLLDKHGRRVEAREMVERALRHNADPARQRELVRMRTELASPEARPSLSPL